MNVKSGVRLRERPTVENAETTSKIAYCVGSCASMGAIICACGTKGKRYIL